MNFEFFVAVSLVGMWALLPISLIIAVKSFDDEAIGGGEHH